jgi:hypothetical protein
VIRKIIIGRDTEKIVIDTITQSSKNPIGVAIDRHAPAK